MSQIKPRHFKPVEIALREYGGAYIARAKDIDAIASSTNSFEVAAERCAFKAFDRLAKDAGIPAPLDSEITIKRVPDGYIAEWLREETSQSEVPS